MLSRVLNKQQALLIFNNYVEKGIDSSSIRDSLDFNYQRVRTDLFSFWGEANKQKGEYQKDLSFALKIYSYFEDKASLSMLENIEFWIYICCCVVPEIVEQRHGLNDEYFFKKSGRIYLQALWQFIHMTYQGSIEETQTTLAKLSTDYILQISERSGKEGYYLEVYREIARVLSILPQNVINKQINGANLCRRVMIQNTAYCDSLNLVFEDDAKEYVAMLFRACGVEVKDYEQVIE